MKKVIIFLVIIFIGVLGYGLYKKPKNLRHRETGLPEMTQEDWDKYNSLPVYNNETDKSIESTENDYKLVCKNKLGKEMTYKDALDIVKKSTICMSEGVIDFSNSHIPYCGGFPDFVAIPLLVDGAEGCAPHCLVNIDTNETKINWMCTGVLIN